MCWKSISNMHPNLKKIEISIENRCISRRLALLLSIVEEELKNPLVVLDGSGLNN